MKQTRDGLESCERSELEHTRVDSSRANAEIVQVNHNNETYVCVLLLRNIHLVCSLACWSPWGSYVIIVDTARHVFVWVLAHLLIRSLIGCHTPPPKKKEKKGEK